MYILTQDKTQIINLDKYYGVSVFSDGISLGIDGIRNRCIARYDTEERAIEVMEDICRVLTNLSYSPITLYRLPKE